MDNLTHSLIGAALGQAGLKRKTGLAMPALILGANLPDVDVGCFVWLDGVEHLAFRRGITHGPIALVVLPLLLAGALWAFDRWQIRRGSRPESRLPVHFGWLLALSFLACLTHPLFDWFNNYGIRLLEPFSSRWFYGDTLFIIDVWIIAMLGAGIWLSLRRERAGSVSWPVPAKVGLLVAAAFVAFNMWISEQARDRFEVVRTVEESRRVWVDAKASVANAVPVAFWKRDVLWRVEYGVDADRIGSMFGSLPFDLFSSASRGPYEVDQTGGESHSLINGQDSNMSDPRIALWARHDPQARAFLFWSRMPIAELHPDRIVLRDQRFIDPRVAGRFTVTLRPPR